MRCLVGDASHGEKCDSSPLFCVNISDWHTDSSESLVLHHGNYPPHVVGQPWFPKGWNLNHGEALRDSCIHCKTFIIPSSPTHTHGYMLLSFFTLMLFNLRVHLPIGQALKDEVILFYDYYLIIKKLCVACRGPCWVLWDFRPEFASNWWWDLKSCLPTLGCVSLLVG